MKQIKKKRINKGKGRKKKSKKERNKDWQERREKQEVLGRTNRKAVNL
jgi:hypothetical protein